MVNLLLRPQRKSAFLDACDPETRSLVLQHQMIKLRFKFPFYLSYRLYLGWHVILYTLDAEFGKPKFCRCITVKKWTHTS